MKEVELDLHGMFAVLTPSGLQDQLTRMPGVAAVNVDDATGATRIVYDEQRTNLKKVRAELVECGYHCAMEVMPDQLCDPEAATRSE